MQFKPMAWPCRLAATNPPPRDCTCVVDGGTVFIIRLHAADFFSMAQGYLSDAVLNQVHFLSIAQALFACANFFRCSLCRALFTEMIGTLEICWCVEFRLFWRDS